MSQLFQLEIHEVTGETDLQSVQRLCGDFRDWLCERYQGHLWLIDRYYSLEQWATLLDDLPRIHEPPDGEMLLACLDREPVGCVMLRRFSETACEMKRLFVSPTARGYGVGKSLCGRIMSIAAERGYGRMYLDTGIHHAEAIALYRSLGFSFTGRYYDCPSDVAAFLHFMEISLTAAGRAGDESRGRRFEVVREPFGNFMVFDNKRDQPGECGGRALVGLSRQRAERIKTKLNFRQAADPRDRKAKPAAVS